MSLIYLITKLPILSRGNSPIYSSSKLLEDTIDLLGEKNLGDFKYIVMYEELNIAIKLRMDMLSDKKTDKEIEKSLKDLYKKKRMSEDENEWIYQNMSSHYLLRNWYNLILKNGSSLLFKNCIEYLMNIDESLAIILAKKNKLSKEKYKNEFKGMLDVSFSKFKLDFDESNKHLIQSVKWYNKLNQLLELNDFVKIEKEINSLKLDELDKILKHGDFSLDFIIIYYLKLKIHEREVKFSKENGKKIFSSMLNIKLEELNDI